MTVKPGFRDPEKSVLFRPLNRGVPSIEVKLMHIVPVPNFVSSEWRCLKERFHCMY